MKKTALFLLTAALMAQSMVSCAGSGNPSDTSSADGVETEAAKPEINWHEDAVPEKDFGGKTITVRTVGQTRGAGDEREPFSQLYIAKENGDAINDATYMRNQHIKDKYNLDIAVSFGASNADEDIEAVVSSLLAGDYLADIYDCILWFMEKMSSQGLLLDMRTLPYVNFDQPWWDKQTMEDYSVTGEYLFTFGDIITGQYDTAAVYYFNKDILESCQLESPYTLVEKNKWTIDTFIEYCKNISSDVNGDGMMDMDDMYGYTGGATSTYIAMVGGGSKTMARSEEGEFIPDLITERSLGILDKVKGVMYDEHLAYIGNINRCPDGKRDGQIDYEIFSDNRALFFQGVIKNIIQFRDEDVNFGVVPLPKYDEAQDRYYAPLNAGSGMLAVASNTPNTEEVGFALEALCAASPDTLRPAYIETTLKTKGTRDKESMKMLDIIIDSLTIDIGQVYNFGDINGKILYNFEREKMNNLVSRYESLLPKISGKFMEVAKAYKQIYGE